MPRHRFTDTRERIERAAIRLFVEKGVAEAVAGVGDQVVDGPAADEVDQLVDALDGLLG